MKFSAVYFNDQYIEVTSWNHGGALVLNLDFDPLLLPIDIDAQNLGRSIRVALNANKKIPPESLKEFIFSPITNDWMENRKKNIMKKYGYKTKKILFRNMRNVFVKLMDKEVVVSPTHQDGLDFSFTGLKKVDDLIIDINCSDEELGRTVKLAYEKCTSIY